MQRSTYGQREMRSVSHFIRSIPEEYLHAPQLIRNASARGFRNTNISRPTMGKAMDKTTMGKDAAFKYRQNLSTLPNATAKAAAVPENYDALQVGTRVEHQLFGKGAIIRFENPNNGKVYVKFDNGEVKTLLLQYASWKS